MWPTEPAKADWSFNKWQKTRILKQRHPRLPNSRRRNSRRRNGRAWAAVRGAVVALVDVVDVAVAVVVDRAPDADAVRPVARAAVRDAATMLADGAGLVADAAAMASRAIVTDGAGETVAASSSRT